MLLLHLQLALLKQYFKDKRKEEIQMINIHTADISKKNWKDELSNFIGKFDCIFID